MPRRTWGDPHIETLDGIEFDYFGIGQFWDCKSEENDFGCQVRYFHYKQTSLTGAVALKAGSSVVTITTPAVAQPGDVPTVRLVSYMVSPNNDICIPTTWYTITLKHFVELLYAS